MIGIVSGIVLIIVALLALALQRLYSSIPARELKRLAQRGDHLAQALYRVVAYGTSLRILLWAIAVITVTAGALLVVPHLPLLVSVIVLLGLSATMLVFLPATPLTAHTAQWAAWISPVLTWVLSHLHPLLDKAAQLSKRRVAMPHTALYEKEDLQHILTRQREQVDNRIHAQELELVERALAFGDKRAADIAQSSKAACLVNADDTIGPILLDQLHKSMQTSFLVYKDTKDSIMGSLAMRDAVHAKEGGRVFDLVRNDLSFVHEDFTLPHVLTALQKTGHSLAVVINSFEEFVGVITLDSLLQELRGAVLPSEENYDNRSAIAAYKPKTDTDLAVEEQPQMADTPSPEATEVVE